MPSGVLSNCTSLTHEASVRVENSIIKRKMENGKRKTSQTENGKRKTESGKVIKRDTESMRVHGRDTACRVRKQKRSRCAVSPTSLWKMPTSTPFDWVLKNVFFIFSISAFYYVASSCSRTRHAVSLQACLRFPFTPPPIGRVGVGLFSYSVLKYHVCRLALLTPHLAEMPYKAYHEGV